MSYIGDLRMAYLKHKEFISDREWQIYYVKLKLFSMKPDLKNHVIVQVNLIPKKAFFNYRIIYNAQNFKFQIQQALTNV